MAMEDNRWEDVVLDTDGCTKSVSPTTSTLLVLAASGRIGSVGAGMALEKNWENESVHCGRAEFVEYSLLVPVLGVVNKNVAASSHFLLLQI